MPTGTSGSVFVLIVGPPSLAGTTTDVTNYAAQLHAGLPKAHGELTRLGRIGLTVTLFLIGTGITRRTIREVGLRPLVQGLLLWFIVAAGSLMLIRAKWVRL
jgi:uncharacterized membrane protein YadS